MEQSSLEPPPLAVLPPPSQQQLEVAPPPLPPSPSPLPPEEVNERKFLKYKESYVFLSIIVLWWLLKWRGKKMKAAWWEKHLQIIALPSWLLVLPIQILYCGNIFIIWSATI